MSEEVNPRGGNAHSRAGRLVAAIGALVTSLAISLAGCGGGSNNSVIPFAGLWVASNGFAVVPHFAGTQLNLNLGGADDITPQQVLHSSYFISPQNLTFDPKGNVWVVDGGLNDGLGTGAAVYEFGLSQLKNLNSQPSPSPAFIVASPRSAPFFVFPQAAAFDSSRNLWVSDSGSNQIIKFKASLLSNPKRVALTSSAMLQGTTPNVFSGPIGMAFDSKGNLWVANNVGNTIVEIASAVLAAASGPVNPVTPVTTLTNPAGAAPNIDNPWGMTFDTNGNLWFTNEQLDVSKCSGSVVEFAATMIAGGGTLSPPAQTVLTQTAISTTQSLCDPQGLSMTIAIPPAPFGDIAVANAGNNSVARYSASQITTSGSPVPTLLVIGGSTSLSAPAGLTYGPLTLE